MPIRVCIACIHDAAYSETFVRNHRERLPFELTVLHGAELPYLRDGVPLLSDAPPLRERARRTLEARLLGAKHEDHLRRRIARLLREERIDVVLAEFGPCGAELLPPCQAAGIPLVVMFRGGTLHREDERLRLGTKLTRVVREAAGVVGVSRELAERLREMGARAERTHCIPSGVDVDQFQGGDPAAAPERFLFVGRFVDKKAPHLLLEAFRHVKREVETAELTLVGDGPLLEATRQLAAVWGLVDCVRFEAPCEPADVVAHMRRARAYVQHSCVTTYGDVEGTPNAVVEASACGLPVVATRHGGIKDVVVDGETGFLVDELDVAGMAEAMVRLARDPDLAGRLGKAGRERAQRTYSLSDSLAQLQSVLEKAARSTP